MSEENREDVRNAESILQNFEAMGIKNSKGPSERIVAELLNLDLVVTLAVRERDKELVDIRITGEQEGGWLIFLHVEESIDDDKLYLIKEEKTQVVKPVRIGWYEGGFNNA